MKKLLARFGIGGKSSGQGDLDNSSLLGSTGRDRRMYRRYPLQPPTIMVIDFGDRKPVEIRDISYGGITCAIASVPDSTKHPEGAKATLHFFNQQSPAVVGHVYSRDNLAAFMFHHNTPDTLLFLREPLEGIRQGSTLEPVQGNLLKPPYNQGGWTCFFGDGPTSLNIEHSTDGQLQQALMTFRDGKIYREASFRQGQLFTGQSIDNDGVPATRMTTDRKPDPRVLRIAAAILTGVTNKTHRAVCLDFLELILDELGTKDGMRAAG